MADIVAFDSVKILPVLECNRNCSISLPLNIDGEITIKPPLDAQRARFQQTENNS